MTEPERRLDELEARLRRVEDELDIRRLMMSYAPAADADLPELAASYWTQDGSYEINGTKISGRTELEEFFRGERHQRNVRAGCVHPSSPPRITVDGDRAVAVCYQHLGRWTGDGFELPNYSASVWEFVRTEAGWRVASRVLRLLDGNPDGRAVLAAALAAHPLSP